MGLILNIETATEVCSAAIAENGSTIAIREDNRGRSHSTTLAVFINELMKEVDISANELDAVSVSKGPGSYTGLRIGVSTAKGICYAAGKPLIGIPTLQAMAWGMANHHMHENSAGNRSPLLCPMIDARRMEVFAAVYDTLLREIVPSHAEIITEESYRKYLEKGKMIFFGNGSAKCRETITSQNALFFDNVNTSSRYMEKLSEESFINNKFEDTAYFEPFYLKDFIATTPKKKI